MPGAKRGFVYLVTGLLVFVAVAAILAATLRPSSDLTPFHSYAELSAYLDRVQGSSSRYSLFEGAGRGFFGDGLLGGPSAGTPVSWDYSRTNVQVEGIDELDVVKTDGMRVYAASGGTVAIIQAVPPDGMAVLARLPVPVDPALGNVSDVRVVGMFVESDRVAIVASAFEAGDVPVVRESFAWVPTRSWTLVAVYDVSVVAAPALTASYSFSGTLLTGRMAAPFVYLATNDWIAKLETGYVLPEVCRDGACAAVDAPQIYYDPLSPEAGVFTNIVAFDIGGGTPTVLSVVTGYTSTFYMSPSALYLSFAKWETSGGILPVASVSTTWTTIHKVNVEGLTLTPVAHGDVPGTLLNQFSMDEYAGFLRVATTSWESTPEGGGNANSVYVLDPALEIVGRLEGLAPGETIHSARFLGDRVYLVTFQKIDPFFVIDLSSPTSPRVLGYLKIPGFSDYLHPVDETHILGIGKDTAPGDGNFSWFEGLKLSLFDVADVTHPVEESKLVIGDRGTDSEVLRDHKAFLSIPARSLVVLPVSLARIDPADWPDPIPSWAWGETIWQGAYALQISPDAGLSIHGTVSHLDLAPSPVDPYAGLDPAYMIQRSLYIGDVLYTISPTIVKANYLADLQEIGAVDYTL